MTQVFAFTLALWTIMAVDHIWKLQPLKKLCSNIKRLVELLVVVLKLNMKKIPPQVSTDKCRLMCYEYAESYIRI